MAYLTPDRVLEGSTTAGPGDFTLTGNVIGFRAFSAVASIGDLLPYYIESVNQIGVPSGAYEVGLGRYKAANTLERVIVKASSNGGALVNFAAGQKIVGVGVPGWDAVTKSSRVGEVVFIAGTTPKDGTLIANSAAISRTTYANLWEFAQASGLLAASAPDKVANQAKFGLGDGSTTFELPNLVGRTLVAGGGSFSVGGTGGSKDAVVIAHTHTGTVSASGAHAHTVVGATSAGSAKGIGEGGALAIMGSDAAGGLAYRNTLAGYGTQILASVGDHAHTVTVDSSGVSGTNANMPPYASLLACIYY